MHETSPVSAFLRHIQLLYDESFAASAYCVQYISIACEAANGHTCVRTTCTREIRVGVQAENGRGLNEHTIGYTKTLLLLFVFRLRIVFDEIAIQ